MADLARLGRHSLTYFATAGTLLLLLAGFLLWLLIDRYNDTRKLGLLHAVATFLTLALGHTLLITGVVAYVASRRSYPEPLLPHLPKAATVALIPAYNEEETIASIVREAKKYVDMVIVADDGSRDGTAKTAEEAGAVVVRHPYNMGYGAAVRTLMRAALSTGAQYAVLLDADGQHDPADIPKFLEKLREGADVVIGNRFKTSKMPTYRKMGIQMIRLALRLFGVKTGDPENGYRAFNRKALEVLVRELEETWMGISSQTVYIASRRKLRVEEVQTTVRYKGTSSESPVAHGLSVLWTIIWTWLTEKPRRTLAAGIAALAASAALFTYVILLFNATRYIRLTYTTSAILLETIATILIAVAVASAVKK
ncbi:MAG: glycosyltransferase family 2 protein [Thermoproteus sp.]